MAIDESFLIPTVGVPPRIDGGRAATGLVSRTPHAITSLSGSALAKLLGRHCPGFAVPGSSMGRETEPDLDL